MVWANHVDAEISGVSGLSGWCGLTTLMDAEVSGVSGLSGWCGLITLMLKSVESAVCQGGVG